MESTTGYDSKTETLKREKSLLGKYLIHPAEKTREQNRKKEMTYVAGFILLLLYFFFLIYYFFFYFGSLYDIQFMPNNVMILKM